jgi:hypothetical protein
LTITDDLFHKGRVDDGDGDGGNGGDNFACTLLSQVDYERMSELNMNCETEVSISSEDHLQEPVKTNNFFPKSKTICSPETTSFYRHVQSSLNRTVGAECTGGGSYGEITMFKKQDVRLSYSFNCHKYILFLEYFKYR